MIEMAGWVLAILLGMVMLYGFLKQEHELIQEWREGTIRETLYVQEKLIDAQAEYLTAHTERIKNEPPPITISGDGLEPHLETIIWDLFEKIQIRAAKEGLNQLFLDNSTVDNRPEQDSILEEILTRDDRLRPDQGGLL